MNPRTIVEIDFHGHKAPARVYGDNQYLEVATKVELAHAGAAPEPGFSEVSHDFIKCGPNNEHEAIRIGIEYKGKTFYGTAQIKWGGKNVDAIDPVENAETSARGRALAAAGFEVGSMASAEDMARVLGNGHARVVESEPLALPDPEMRPPDGMNWQEWAARIAKSKGITDRDQYLAHLTQATGKKTNYITTDYQKAVNFFITLPDPVVREQTNE